MFDGFGETADDATLRRRPRSNGGLGNMNQQTGFLSGFNRAAGFSTLGRYVEGACKVTLAYLIQPNSTAYWPIGAKHALCVMLADWCEARLVWDVVRLVQSTPCVECCQTGAKHALCGMLSDWCKAHELRSDVGQCNKKCN
jgi:hypothetical protein